MVSMARARQSRRADQNAEASAQDEEEYEVEGVEGRRERFGRVEYLIRWRGYEEQTWEPELHLSCDELIQTYERQHRHHEAPAVAAHATPDRQSSVDHSHVMDVDMEEETSNASSAGTSMARFLLVVDDWESGASALLLLRQDGSASPLRVQHVAIDVLAKSVTMLEQELEVVGGSTLSPSACLVAARVVENEELAIRVCLVVFLDSGASEDSTSPGNRKRRRAMLNERQDAWGDSPSLYFFILTHLESGRAQLRLVNRLPLPSSLSGPPARTDSELQVLLVDGPHVVLFSRAAQQVTIVRLFQDGDMAEFHVWRDAIRLCCGTDQDVLGVTSCEFVPSTAATHAHLLIHADYSLPTDSGNESDPCIRWFVYPTDAKLPKFMLQEASECVYLPVLPPAIVTKESVRCCCVIDSQLPAMLQSTATPEWLQSLHATRSSPTSVDQDELRVDLAVGSLLVVGTTRNTVYVYTNGLLLTSIVLPAEPEEIHFVGKDRDARRCVVAVRCSNLSRSFYLLSFDSAIRSESMEILQAFSHVGHAVVGELIPTEASVLPQQVLLLNHVSSSDGLKQANTETAYDLLFKRSVLVEQKSGSAKTHSVRLRLREGSKQKTSGVKRSREKHGSGDSPRPFQFIERTHRGSSSKEPAGGDDDMTRSLPLGSQAHLQVLIKSLETRLAHGRKELERLEDISRDKEALTRRLNQLSIREWGEAESSAVSGEKPSPFQVYNAMTLLKRTGQSLPLETVIAAPPSTTLADDEDAGEMSSEVAQQATAVECAVVMSDWTLLQYVPSSSLLRIQVTLVNNSSIVLRDVFVSMTFPSTEASSLQSVKASSSVVPELPSTNETQESKPFRVLVELELLQPPTEFAHGHRPLQATVWLHWKAGSCLSSQDLSNIPDLPPGSFPLGSVNISASDLIRLSDPSISSSGAKAFNNRERLEMLFISAGSSLPPWFQQLQASDAHALDHVLVRSTFARVDLPVGEPNSATLALGQALSSLPRDVLVMANPLHAGHLMKLQQILRWLRCEILSVQRNELVGPIEAERESFQAAMDSDAHDSSADTAARAPFTHQFRLLQHETDLRVAALLGSLQQRDEFHRQWMTDPNDTTMIS